MQKGTILLLNGVSSACKTTLAEKFQAMMPEPSYHMQVNAFCNMLNERYHVGEWSQRRQVILDMHAGMHESVAVFSRMGHFVIVDHVFEAQEWLVDAVERLADDPVVFVGVHCPPEELERHERERGDRPVGQSVSQLEPVHRQGIYDLEVNTHTQSLEECVAQIQTYLNSGQQPNAFKQLREKLVATQ